MTPAGLLQYSLTRAVDAVAGGEVSVRALVDASLARIEATDDAIGAFASVQADAARARAAELDATDVRGALHGIPIALKDLIFTAGTPTEANCGALTGFTPDHDATVVRRLHDAGAVIIGKTNTHELALGVSCPASRNPWNTDRMTGGSSGGSAAALAARQIFGALGTDTGGSVRIPSSYCGTTAIKTTRGQVPRDGMHLLSWTYDTVGPMARTAQDCRLLLDVIAGASTADPYSSPSSLLMAADPSGLRLGVPCDAWLANAPIDAAVLQVFRSATTVVGDIVASATEVALPAWETHSEHGSVIVRSEAAALTADLRARAGERMRPQTRSNLDAADARLAVELAAAQDVRQRFEAAWRGVFDSVDLVICPVTPNHVLDHGIEELHGLPLIQATTQFTFAVNGAGLPAISLPSGFGPDGLPIGVQLIGPPHSERTLAAVGALVQTVTDHHDHAPPTTCDA